jgi:VWFA-related protein
VQVSVVAQDKQGKPVADLRREEFQIFDNGSPQKIQLFVAEMEESNPAAQEPKAPHTFTNRIAPSAGSRGGYSVILIDNFLTNFGDPLKGETGSGGAVQRTLTVLRSIPMSESTAIYALQRKLHVVCEFTTDRDLLERQLRTWKEAIDTPGTAVEILGDGSVTGDGSLEVRTEAARLETLRRSSASDGEMEQIAHHLAGIPGRKNLIWLANSFAVGGLPCKSWQMQTWRFIPCTSTRRVRARP